LPLALGGQALRQKIELQDEIEDLDEAADVHYGTPDADNPATGESPEEKKPNRFKPQWPPSKLQIIIALVVVILIGGSVSAWALTRHPATKPVATVSTIKTIVKPMIPVSTTVASDLSGLQVSPSVNSLPVTAVMVENSTFARPQAGLSQASVVFEAVAEGGVTRFMALYQDTSPSNVGPIRSVRPYYISWAMGFDASIAHVGGSPDALADMTSWGARDLDEFYNGSYYHRITTRDAPHNVYTGIATLNQLETSKGYNTSTYTSWPRKADAPTKNVTAGTINFALSGPTYDPQYIYDATTNSYNRSEAGAPQMDSNTNTQISPKVVIAIVVPETQGALDSSGAYYSDYTTIGSGVADVFEDGTVTPGQWTKSSNASQITFTDASGQPIKLDAGQTWVTTVTTPANISYTP
jgi:hypothetical protein